MTSVLKWFFNDLLNVYIVNCKDLQKKGYFVSKGKQQNKFTTVETHI